MQAAEKLLTENLDVWSSAIKAKSSAGRGSGKKRELYGVGKLRGLILDLAVRGLLAPQENSDVPASDLIPNIKKVRADLIAEGINKKQKATAPIAHSELPFSIPSKWQWTRLGTVTNYGVCGKILPDDVDDETWSLELEDVEKTTSKLLTRVRFSTRKFKTSKNVFNQSDVIYGKLRPYLDKVLVADEPGVCTTEMIPLRGYASISPHYLRSLVSS